MTLSPVSLTLLLFCSQLGLDEGSARAMTLREWNPLQRRLNAAALPFDSLLHSPLADLEAQLSLSTEETARIHQLRSRSDELERELERLAAQGIYALTRVDPEYPIKYLQRLKDSAPPVLFYAGEKGLLGQPGIAVVGSRHLDETGQECAKFVGNACGFSGQVLYSGGAKGVDTISMQASLDARGTAVGILADSLDKAVRIYKDVLRRGDLCLATPYLPSAGFSVGAAMGRNRLIYCLADYAIVVASDAETGGTWAGAIEALKNGWLPLFVLEHPEMPAGNRLLLSNGALSFPHPFSQSPLKLGSWLAEKSAFQAKSSSESSQLPLF